VQNGPRDGRGTEGLPAKTARRTHSP
jgi:hypothetical protein